jgi:hypothetical protein
MNARPVARAPNDRLLLVVLLAAVALVGFAWHSGVSEIPSSPNAPSITLSDSPGQSTMAAAMATMAFVPTSTVTPTRTATVAPTETVGPTVLPYCKTIQEGVCLMYEQGQSAPHRDAATV